LDEGKMAFTSPIDVDRPKKLGGRVMGAPRCAEATGE